MIRLGSCGRAGYDVRMCKTLLYLVLASAVIMSSAKEKRAKAAPPEVHMLVDGFAVQRLPLQLTNLVNLQYRHDNQLVALGYNGNIWLLSDTDGDGLEDKADLFWAGKGKITAPIGMDLAPKGTPHGDAVFFACKGKVMMVADHDGDGKAEEEKVIAEGWPLARAGVDAASLCYDPKDGAVFFGLGVKWYNNAYELDESGVAHNDLGSERGAILRIAPDFKSRERICTGVRWPIGLRFNAHGDLFCTDQEGATWLPNGNPFDELLHIERGRHYGFPPAHPKHLPDVIDEPSVFDYGPQHQSTCGLRFNEGVNGGPHFGPAYWKGDALVAAESRGKIYRTKLVKTEHGYVAQNQIIACLNQLAVDLTVTPRGDLLVATHSGNPDWGTGPEGKGSIFAIHHADRDAMRPMLAAPLRENLFGIFMDRPAPGAIGLNPLMRHGLYHHAGDDHETMWPGYDVITLQQRAPVTEVRDRSGRWSDDRRALFITTPPQSAADTYSFKAMPHVDIDTALTGVSVTWRGADQMERQCWLPHLDTEVNRELLREHMPDLAAAESITMRTRLDLGSMLRPAVQINASLDHDPPPEEVTLRISSPNTPFYVKRGFDAAARAERSQPGQITHDAFITVTPQRNAPLDLAITCRAAGGAPEFQVSWHTKQDTRERAMPLRRFLVPWCRPELTRGLATLLPRPEIQGADWARGRDIFKSDKALCSKCHAMRGEGGKIGPDLSNCASRDFATVKRDIHDPHGTINPDYVTHDVRLKDGRQFTAVLRHEGDDAVLGIGAGVEVRVANGDIASQTPLKPSLMIPALDDVLGARDFRDLMAYLLTAPPLMGVYADGERPARRTRIEIDAALAGAPSPSLPVRDLKVLLVSGKKDHGKGEHDYPRWREVWGRLFSLAEKTTLDIAEEWPAPEQWSAADAVVFYRRGDWSDERAKDFDAFLKRGGGATFIHWSLEAGEQAPALAARLGLASNRRQTKFRHGPLELVFDDTMQHPIARNFSRVRFNDEMYWNLVPSDKAPMRAMANADENGTLHPQAWTQEPATGGRVFVTLGGHYSWNFDDALFRTLLLRGIAWSAKEPVDRFNNLIEAGLE